MSPSDAFDRGRRRDFRSALPAVLFVSFIFFINYTDRAIVGPLLVHVEKSLGIDHAQATSILFFMSAGYCLGLLGSGFVTAAVIPRRVVAFSAIGCGVMLLLAARSIGLAEARACFFLMGVSGGLYLPAAMATLGSVAPPETWSRTIAVHELAPTLSFIVSPLLAERVAAVWGWPVAMAGIGVFSILCGGLFLFFGPGGREKTDRPSAGGIATAVKKPVFWLFVWLFALAVGGEFAPYSVLPLSLTAEQGFESSAASRLISLSRMASPLVVLVGGWTVPRLGAVRSTLLFLLVQGLSLAALALPLTTIGLPGLFIAMSLQAMAAAFVFPALFTLFASSFPQGQQPVLLSLSVPMASSFGTGLTPYLLGVCGEYWHFSAGYLIFGLFCLATVPFLLAHAKPGR